MAVSLSFDKDVVVRVIQQLENIRDAIEEIQERNDRADQEDLQKYEAVVRQVKDVSKRLGEDLRVLRKRITKQNQEKLVAEKKRDQLQVDVPEAQDLLLYNRQQLELQQALYNARKLERGAEIQVVWNAYQVLVSYKDRN